MIKVNTTPARPAYAQFAAQKAAQDAAQAFSVISGG
jgi:hypothetical protein